MNNQKQTLIIVSPKDFQYREFLPVKEALEKNNLAFQIASTESGTAISSNNEVINIDKKISDVNLEDYSAIVIIGGIGVKKYLWDDLDLRKLVQNAYKKNIIVAAICIGPIVLLRSGILTGKEATCYPMDETKLEFEKYNVKMSDKNSVISENIVTGKNPDSAIEFANNIINLI